MTADNNIKRTARLGRGLTSLMAGVPAVVSAGSESGAPSTTVSSRARLAVNAPVDGGSESSVDPIINEGIPPHAIVRAVPLNSITPNPYQPRKQFDPKALEQLAASIRLDGVMQPILVRPKQHAEGQFELIAGERRWRAAQLAELETIPAIVRELSDQDTAEWALVENLQREDLNPIERGEAFQQLVERYQLSHEQVADRVGVDRSTITNALRLLALHSDVQQFVRDGLLSASQAKVLAGLSDGDAQRALAVQAVRDAWSVRQVEQAVRDVVEAANPSASNSPAKAKRARSAHTADLERQISQQLSTKVRIHQGKKKGTGTLAIDFYSLEQFDDLLARLGVKIDES